MNKRIIRYGVMVVVVIGLITVVAMATKPITEARAAARAAECFGWPKEVIEKSSAIVRGKTVPGAGMALAFDHAKMVMVLGHGACTRIIDTQVMSTAPLPRLPPSSIVEFTSGKTREQNGTYVLLLIGVDKYGDRTFVGMKGASVEVELPATPEPPAPPLQGSVA